MPELPEVESIRRVLENSLINQNLQKDKIFDDRINRFNSVKPKNLGVLFEIYRKGKILQFNFKNNSILFHLGMSGRLDLNSSKNKHTHGIFFFEKDELLYDDIRKFGYIKILKNELVNKQNQGYASSEADIMNHMNDHHNESIKLYLQKFIKNIKATEKSGRWKIVGIDPDGFDLRKKNLLTRLYFDREITDSKKLRGMFVKLHKEALEN